MTHDNIAEVEIDEVGHLRIRPELATFPYIYREAIEVSWHQEDKVLYSPKPRDWHYGRWFEQILSAASEQGCKLSLTTDTKWRNVDEQIKEEILNAI